MASARLGQSSTKDSVSVRFDAKNAVRLVDRYTGNFRSGAFYRAMSRANEQAAIRVQEGMRDAVAEKVGIRPQRPGHRLERSIMDEKNREVFANTFSVGLENWLDRSPAALYWRQIEYGNVERQVRSLFTDSNGPPFGPPFFGPNRGGLQLRLPELRGGVLMTIGPFPAFHYSRGGQIAFARLDMFALYRKELGAIGIELTQKDIP